MLSAKPSIYSILPKCPCSLLDCLRHSPVTYNFDLAFNQTNAKVQVISGGKGCGAATRNLCAQKCGYSYYHTGSTQLRCIFLALAPSSCFAHVNIVFLSHKSPVLLLSPLRCLKFPGVSMISASLHRDTIRQHAALLTFETHHVLQIFLSVMCLLSLCIFRNILIFSSSPARFMCLAVQRNSLNRRVRSQTPADVG